MLRPYTTFVTILVLIYLTAASEESGVVGIAPTSQVFIGDKLYYIENRIQRHWFDARKYCEAMGYNLLSLDTAEKIKAINSYLDSQKDKNIYWTSGNDFLTLGQHLWFPSGQPVASNLWHPNEPNNAGGIEHCDVFGHTASRLMNDLDCTIKKYYICEPPLKINAE